MQRPHKIKQITKAVIITIVKDISFSPLIDDRIILKNQN